MKINRQILRGYDIRGEVGKDINAEIVRHFGKAYGTYVLNKLGSQKVIIGCDCRLTSEEYKVAFIEGVNSTGLNVIDIGLVLVGHIYWSQYHFKTPAAAMITASHNPKEFNGIKMSNNYSEAMVKDELNELTDIVENEQYIKSDKIGSVEEINIYKIYNEDLTKRFNIRKFKVVVDPSCSTAGAIVPDLLRLAGCEVIESNCNLDGSFPLGVADPTEEIVAKRLAKKVMEEKADLGFSYDSDGDRMGIVDEKGTIIWNDVLVALFAVGVLSRHPGAKIMYNTLCSKLVAETINKYGGVPFMWRTGHGFLKKKNQEVRAAFIGELSGHFFFSADFYNHDDGCYASLALLDYLTKTNQSLNQALSALPQYISSPEIKLYCPDDKKVQLMEKLSPILKQDYPDAEVVDDERAGDGVRLELADSMFVIRYSQNGPYITIKFEAKTQEQYEKLKKYIRELLQKFSEVDWKNEIRTNVESLLK